MAATAVVSAFTGAIASKILSSGEDFVNDWRSSPSSSCAKLHIPELPNSQVGLGEKVEELKRRLFQENVNKVGVSAMGGSGKTTLAVALCEDPQVKERFGNKIIFQKVSESPDIKKILKSIWVGITGNAQAPNFWSIQDARTRLKALLSSKQPQNILVVLDDVWHEDDLKELLFEAEGYKTVVTARQNFKCLNTYDLPLLEKEDALSLFCYEAFGQKSIPDRGYNKTLVKQVAEECQGLPLALVVIGRSLNGQSNNAYWEHARDKLSEGGPIDKVHEKGVFKRLAVSIEMLDDDDMKQCFLDLALFPVVKKVPVDTLFDIWIYAHNLKQSNARKNLLELERRRLLTLVNHNMGIMEPDILLNDRNELFEEQFVKMEDTEDYAIAVHNQASLQHYFEIETGKYFHESNVVSHSQSNGLEMINLCISNYDYKDTHLDADV